MTPIPTDFSTFVSMTTKETMDTESKKIQTELGRITLDYIGSGSMEKDLAAMKPLERLRFYTRLLPYVLPRDRNAKADFISQKIIPSALLHRAGLTLA